MKHIITLLITVLTTCSCVHEFYEQPGLEKDDTKTSPDSVQVQFRITNAFKTRSSIYPDEESIHDINIFVYRGGNLQTHHYSTDPTVVILSLPKGYTYSIYALANIGKRNPPVKEVLIGSLALSITSIYELEECLPMAWQATDIAVGSTSPSINIDLERLTSKIWFNIDHSLLEGLTVTGVKLCQAASTVRPFQTGGSKARIPFETIDGDEASSNDLYALNSGESICFYTLENNQGVLLPDNHDPWNKTPDSLGDTAKICTYIEVECEFQEGFLYSGTVTYRFFPGADNISDFSILRNTEMNITLCLTGEGIREISWKVDPNVTVQPGFIDGWIDEGRHAINDLYVGEQFIVGVDVAPELLTHLGGDLTGCTLVMHSSDGGEIRFDKMESEPGYTDTYVTGTCTAIGTGSIWIYDPEGIPAAEVFTNVKVQKPNLIISFYSSVGVSELDYAIDEYPWCVINGRDEILHMYLADSKGYNLNTDYWCGFDASLFSFEADPYKEAEFDILSTIDITMTPGKSNSEGPVATYTISCRNDGSDPDVNYDLCRSMSLYEAFYFDIDENNYSISNSIEIALEMEQVTLTVVDNGWARYFGTQASLKVDNPSNLPLIINGWQVNTCNDDWNAISRNQYLDYVNDNMLLTRASYVTSNYYDNDVTLYGNGVTIYSEPNSEGDQCIEENGVLIYPLTGLETNECLKVQLVDYHGQEALFHLFDVRLPNRRLYSNEVKIVDNLEDGSMTYSIIYGDDPENPGWNNQGMWLYSKSSLISKSSTSFDKFNNITALRLQNLMDRYNSTGPMAITLSYDSSAGQLYATCSKGNPYNLKFDVSITGTVNGYVETYPNGTWGSGKDNYCTATINGGVSGVTIGTGKTSIDGGAIKAGMDAIYAQTFYDSKNWIGSSNSYQHSAHPTSVSVQLWIKVSSTVTNATELYPVSISWSNSSLPYYHSQDGTTYNPSFTKAHHNFDFVRYQTK